MAVLPSLLGAADRIRAHPYAIGGYACAFNQVYCRGGVRHLVRPGTFARAIADHGWLLLRDHIEGVPSQASTRANTLHVEEDEYGLWFEASLPDDAAGAQLMDRVRRREITEMSTGSVHSVGDVLDGVQVWSQINAWELSLVTPPGRAARAGTFVYPNLAARRHRSRVRG